ncbi:hypothetical protein M426DRAFT_325179 [Hypoxylon sp. CI-4A]|nr:hypothetical protein M426DRAFT_325179 [Hypoxylon sp. CI-4A]
MADDDETSDSSEAFDGSPLKLRAITIQSKKSQPSRIVIDPDGELCLAVGECDTVTFVVCPKALARASPVWKKLLYGGFAESIQPEKGSGEEWIVKLPEDDPKTMEIVLNIIHCRFDRVPTSVRQLMLLSDNGGFINIYTLYHLTVLTDKYDLSRILQPWASRWVRDLPDADPTNPTAQRIMDGLAQKLLWISWELGDDQIFKQAATYLTLRCDPIEGSLSLSTGTLFSACLEPPDSSSLIERTRLEAIRKMLEPVQDIVNRLLQNETRNAENKFICRYSVHLPESSTLGSNCGIAMLGAIVQSLTKHQLYPVPRPEAVQMNVMKLAEILKTIDTQSRLGGHEHCRALPNVSKRFIAATEQVSPELSESQTRHLMLQAKKTGLD